MKNTYPALLIIACSIIVCPTAYSQTALLPIPYIDTFENGNVGWTVITTGVPSTRWELGTPTFGTTNSTHSGNFCWDVNLNAPYEDNANTTLVSPLISCKYQSSIFVSFWVNYKTELFDVAGLYYSVNGEAPVFITEYNYKSHGWVHHAYAINVGLLDSTLQFSFNFSSDGTAAYDGISIDDFSVVVGTSLNDLSTPDNVLITPNPTKDFCNISINNHSTLKQFNNSTITLFDITGRTITQQPFNTQSTIDLSSFDNGVYIAEVKDNDCKSVIGKVVKE